MRDAEANVRGYALILYRDHSQASSSRPSHYFSRGCQPCWGSLLLKERQDGVPEGCYSQTDNKHREVKIRRTNERQD